MIKRIALQLIFCGIFVLILAMGTNAQQKNLAQKSLSVSKKATVIIVGNSAKYSYKATKFTASKVAKPIIVKSAPKVGMFLLKKSGYTAKKAFPVGRKLFVKYIKYKFLP